MKSRAIVYSIAAAALAFGSLAQAQERDHHGRQDWQQNQQQQPQQNHQQWQQQNHQQWQQQGQHNNWQQQSPAWQNNSGWQQQRDSRYGQRYAESQPRYWRGGYVPYQYRASHYYVNDWRGHRLSAPPYGYQWVQTDGGDYLLMALATGLIANLILSSY